MSSTQGERIVANCEIIWGKDTMYDLEEESNDEDTCLVFVRRDYGTRFGAPLVMSMKNTSAKAWDDMDRMLALRAREVLSAQPTARQ
ncbi:hypothetical protein PG984_016645 [Apiospora sp. TS-2023a]